MAPTEAKVMAGSLYRAKSQSDDLELLQMLQKNSSSLVLEEKVLGYRLQ